MISRRPELNIFYINTPDVNNVPIPLQMLVFSTYTLWSFWFGFSFCRITIACYLVDVVPITVNITIFIPIGVEVCIMYIKHEIHPKRITRDYRLSAGSSDSHCCTTYHIIAMYIHIVLYNRCTWVRIVLRFSPLLYDVE